jgi:hypothetical protein
MPAIVAVSTATFVMWYFPTYYVPKAVPANPYFGAAVTFAFGEGLKNPDLPPQSKLAGFLNHCNPGSLTYDDVTHPIPGGPMSAFQENHRYLMMLVGLCWRVFGVSWAALGPLIGIMAAISSLCVYGILRTRVRPVLAGLAAIALVACPSHLALTHYIRDYAKTPVFFVAFYLMSIVLTRTLSTAKILLMGLVFGLVIGIGGGIRLDLEVVLIILPFLYIFCLPTGVTRMPLARLISLALAFGVFFTMSAPATRNPHNLTSHLLTIGLLKYNHDSMGFGGAPYIWYNESLMTDNYVNTVIQDYNRRLAGTRIDVNFGSPEYHRAGMSLITNIARHFPADFITRFLASSVTTIRDAPWLIVGALPTMYDITDPLIQGLQSSQRGLRSVWNAYGPWVVGIGLILVSWHSLRLALATTGLLLFFTGYSSLQFQPRHFWHLGVIFICAAAFLLEEVLRALTVAKGGAKAIKQRLPRLFDAQRAKSVLAYLVIVTLGLSSTLGVARLYQATVVKSLFEKYRTASLLPATINSVDIANGGLRTIHATPAATIENSDIRSRYDISYIAIKFESTGPLPTSLNLLNNNFSSIDVQQLAGGVTQGPATVYLPWFQAAKTIDIEIRGGEPDGKVSIYSIANPDDFPVPMVLVLPNDPSTLATHNSFITPKRHVM